MSDNTDRSEQMGEAVAPGNWTKATPDEQRAVLLDLLAVIHGDGGHKTQEIGWRLSSAQALETVSNLRTCTPSSPPAQAAPVSGEVDRPVILAAARDWWARNMPDSNVRAVQIDGEGRVKVYWADEGEDGTYTLPVDFMQAATPPASASQVKAAQQRYITLWRKPNNALEWDFYVSEDRSEAEQAHRNLREQGVRDAATYPLGDQEASLSLAALQAERPTPILEK